MAGARPGTGRGPGGDVNQARADSSLCDADCTIPVCGDSRINTEFDPDGSGPIKKEECDTGGNDTDLCDRDCTTATCGDGYRNAEAGEKCDTSGNTYECDSDCTLPKCGDNHYNPVVEQCEPTVSDCDSGLTCTLDCQCI